MDNAAFEGLLRGAASEPPRDFHWALLRLIEYAPYREIRRLLPRERFLAEWPQLAPRVRSRTRREGMEFMHQWFRQHPASHG
ncbi:MAG: hypothetical protein ABSH38_16045 [Verrucomicrobiota bacterium]